MAVAKTQHTAVTTDTIGTHAAIIRQFDPIHEELGQAKLRLSNKKIFFVVPTLCFQYRFHRPINKPPDETHTARPLYCKEGIVPKRDHAMTNTPHKMHQCCLWGVKSGPLRDHLNKKIVLFNSRNLLSTMAAAVAAAWGISDGNMRAQRLAHT